MRHKMANYPVIILLFVCFFVMLVSKYIPFLTDYFERNVYRLDSFILTFQLLVLQLILLKMSETVLSSFCIFMDPEGKSEVMGNEK